jgi:glycosyltransferase involved in cell wall biosynthesis
MAAGTPIVSTDLPGYVHVARPTLDAEVVPAGDVDALAAALHRVLHDPALAARLHEAGRRRAADFSMDRLAVEYLDCYRRAIAHRASRQTTRSRARGVVGRMMNRLAPKLAPLPGQKRSS